MKQPKAIAAEESIPDALAKRIFLLALAGVIAYGAAVLSLMSSMG